MDRANLARVISYQFEYSERLRCAFIGAGEHSYRKTPNGVVVDAP
jgi:hypothetical protein